MERYPGELHSWRLTEYETGLLLGILIGEGHFGGDRRQPHVTLHLHVRHELLLRYLLRRCPGSRLYGPYHHQGRDSYRLIWRGSALRNRLIPLLERLPWADVDPPSYARYVAMKTRYGIDPASTPLSEPPEGDATPQ